MRQGCCLSPSIFILVAEVLAIAIRENQNVRGVQFRGKEIKLTQFADDATCFLADGESLLHLLDSLSIFASWSGLVINRSKTKILSPALLYRGIDRIKGIPVVDKTKILGIWMGIQNTEANTYDWNFKTQLSKISSICDSWYHRHLSMKGKITVMNALLISLLQYPTSVTFTPARGVSEYKKIITAFIWDNKKPKIAYTALIQTVGEGGMKLMDLNIRIKVNILQWTRRLLRGPHMNVEFVLNHLLETEDLRGLLKYRNPPVPPLRNTFRFYGEMLQLWSKFRKFEPEFEGDIRSEPIWFNSYLGDGIFRDQRKKWQQAGIETIHDVCHRAENRIMSHTELTASFGMPCSFLDALGLRLAIPMKWRRQLTEKGQPDPGVTGIKLKLDDAEPEDVDSLSAKRMNSKLLLYNKHQNTAFVRWQEGEDGLQIADSPDWASTCSRVFTSTRETKVQSFNYKTINRVLPCKVFLKRLRISETDECNFCQGRDTIAHFLFNCEIVKPFWQGVCSWFSRADNLYLDRLDVKEFVFGIPKEHHRSSVINTILAHTRYFIHRQKLFHEGKLDLLHWLGEFRDKLRVERWICWRTGKQSLFHKLNRIFKEMG